MFMEANTPAKFTTCALHRGEIAAVEIEFQSSLRFFGDGLAAAKCPEMVPADLNLSDCLANILLTLSDRFPECRERRRGTLPQNRRNKAD